MLMNIKGTKSVDYYHKKLGKIMWDKCGMARNAEGLQWAIGEIRKLREEFWKNVRVPGTDKEFNPELEKAHRVAAEIEAGMVWINSSQDSDPRIPFGGVKQSGIGRELGEAGLEAYTQIKAVHVNLGSKL